MKRAWWYRASGLTSPWWPVLWRGSDEHGRPTFCLTVPGVGALVVAYDKTEDGDLTHE